jgi:uncharacterized membrane protein YedE/YeeE
MEITTVQIVALWAFVLALLFGAIAYKTNFCTMGAVSDWVNMSDKRRLRAWFLAIGVAILGTQGLVVSGLVDVSPAISLTPNFSWLACLVGGMVFGIGMTLGSGCAQRSLVRLGAGNLKSLVVVVLMGVTAFTAFRGLLAFVPRDMLWPVQVKLGEHAIQDQSLVAIVAGLFGMDGGPVLRIALALFIGFGLVWFALKDRGFRRSFDNLLGGVAVGLFIVGGWYATGVVGQDEFEPVPVESMSFVLPTGNTVNYVMTYTGATINFGIAAVLGLITGSFVYSVATRNFRIEGFTSCADMVRHVSGGILMGIGGIVGFGCTIGQGVTGMSTLSMGALLTLSAIIFGSALTMKIQYYRLDENSFFGALRMSLRDMRLLPPGKRSMN